MPEQHILILAGEASGDDHAAEFVRELKLMQPQMKITGMGSQAMKKAGVDVFYDSSKIAVMGLVEVLRHWGDIKQAMNLVKLKLEQTRPDLLILVDYPEFNLKMARHAKSLGIKVLFYISPQVWAWRPRRIHKIGRLIDHMAVIFKFEEPYYQRANIPVSFVGHPLVDKVVADQDRNICRQQLGVADDEQLVGLFPGSRQSELSRLLPLMFETAKKMHQQNPALKFLLPIAAALDYEELSQLCAGNNPPIIPTQGNIYEMISSCDAIVSCSGTVTLEIALLEVPLCIVYRMSWLSYQILSRLITIPHVGLANIVVGKQIVRELLQEDATPGKVSNELFELLDNKDYRQKVKADLAGVRQNLGEGNGAGNMAQLVLDMLKK